MKGFLTAFMFTAVFYAQQSVDLQQAIRRCTRDSNTYLRLEALKLDAAKTELLAARATGNVKYNNQAIHLSSTDYFFPGTTYLNRFNMQTLHQVTKTVPWPSHYAAKIDFAKEVYTASVVDYRRFEYSFKQQLTQNWLNAWLDKKKTELYERHYSALDSMTKLMRERKNFSEADFERLSVLGEEYLLNMNKLRVVFANESRQLKLLINTTEPLDFTNLNWVEQYNVPLLTYDSVMKLVKANRPELAAVKENALLAQKELKLHKTSVWEDPEIGILINPQNTVPYLGTYFTVTLPSFDLKKGSIAKSRIKIQETEQELSIAEKELYTEAINLLDLYTVNFVDLQLAYNYRINAAKDIKTTTADFLEKKADVLTLLESEREYFQTELSFFEALYDYFRSKSDLLFATGLVKELIQ